MRRSRRSCAKRRRRPAAFWSGLPALRARAAEPEADEEEDAVLAMTAAVELGGNVGGMLLYYVR